MRVKANGLVLKSGGHIRKDYPLHTKDVKLEGRSGVATFVQIFSNHSWLRYAVLGGKPSANYGSV